MSRDGSEHKAITDGKQIAILGSLSPDGKQVLYLEVQLKNGIAERVRKLVLAKTTTGTAAPVADIPLNGELLSYCWSPDGKRIAYIWRQVHEGELGDVREKETESHLVVCDPDGKNQRTLVSEKGTGQNTIALAHVSWR